MKNEQGAAAHDAANDVEGDREATEVERERVAGRRGRVNEAGVEIPEGVTWYKILRYKPDGETETLSFQFQNEAVQRFSVTAMPPDWEKVLLNWGSGTYRFHWFREEKPGSKLKGGSAGKSRAKIWDDPNHPTLPAYRRTAAPEPVLVAAVQAAAPESATPGGGAPAMMGMLKAHAEGGKVDLGLAMMFFQMMSEMSRQAQAEAEERHRRWRQEDQDARREREQQHKRDLDAMRERAKLEREEMAAFWERQNEAAAELRAVERGDDRRRDDDEEESELAGEVRALVQVHADAAKQSADMWSKVADAVLPAVGPLVQKVLAGAFDSKPKT